MYQNVSVTPFFLFGVGIFLHKCYAFFCNFLFVAEKLDRFVTHLIKITLQNLWVLSNNNYVQPNYIREQPIYKLGNLNISRRDMNG